MRLLDEVDDGAETINVQNAELAGVTGRDRRRGHRDVGATSHVRLEYLAEVHDVELIAGQHQDTVRAWPQEPMQLLAHRVRGALVPVHAGFSLFGSEDLDEAAGERIEAIGVRHVTVQRGRL